MWEGRAIHTLGLNKLVWIGSQLACTHEQPLCSETGSLPAYEMGQEETNIGTGNIRQLFAEAAIDVYQH